MGKFSKIKARRVFRTRKRQVTDITESASMHIDRHVFRRLNNFAEVGRFMTAWLLLFVVLIGGVAYQSRGLAEYHLSTQSIEGGVLSEGMVGSYTNPNPLFASSTVDLSVSRLLFNSLLTYNEQGALVNDLTESLTRADNGLSYTAVLRKDVKWHDGQRFTSKDVAYTYQAIQNPDTKSPYNVSWQGVQIETVDEYTIRFTLPTSLNAFPLSLTNGIVPAHILERVPFEQLRSSSFTSAPVGTGPFRLTQVIRIDDLSASTKKQRIETIRNDTYFKGQPKLGAVVIYALADDDELDDYLKNRQIDTAIFNSYPQIEDAKDLTIRTIPLLAGSYLFFNTTKPPFDNPNFRKSIAEGLNTNDIIRSLPYPVHKVDSPLLSTHTGYDKTLVQVDTNLEEAGKLLDELGWVRPDSHTFRAKEGKTLEITLTTLEGSDFALIANKIRDVLNKSLGIRVNIAPRKPADIQSALLQHTYDALIYGITLGSDPDVYAYWHSSQAVPDRFNLSLYKSEVADRSLEAGRTRPDVALRAIKYKPFLEAWRKDVPAIGLYQPPVFYVSQSKVFGFEPTRLNSTPDRFYGVHGWEVQTAKRPIIKD